MTRETAKQQIRHDEYSEYLHGSIVANILQVESIIDTIYDSFEQQLCSNCAAMELCTIRNIVMEYYPHRVSTFGCTLFRQCK